MILIILSIGDITTDLQTAGIIPDPIRDLNWLSNGSIWAKHVWNYNTSFTLTQQDITALGSSSSMLLQITFLYLLLSRRRRYFTGI